MKRRKFLVKLSLITGAAHFTNPFTLSSQTQSNMENKLMEPKVLPAYKRRFSEEGARALLGGGAIIKFLATSKDTNGLYALFEAKGIPGMEPPPHIHSNEDETYYILDGTLWFKVGEDEFTAQKGDFVFLPRNVKHEFKVLSEEFHCHVGLFPAGIDDFFLEMSQPHHSLEIPPVDKTPPSPEILEKIAKLYQKYGITT